MPLKVTRIISPAALAVVGALLISTATAEDNSALLHLLQRKGILTSDEVASVQQELARDNAASDAGKIKLNPSISELKLYGDLRFRYQYDTRDPQLDPAPVGVHQDRNEDDRSQSGVQQSRYRFRLRVGAEIKLGENWFGGFELGTFQGSDSGNQTFENGFDDYNIYVTKAYLGWRPNEAFTFTAGKIPNPFYTTELVWDADITPSGVAEIIKFHELFGGEVDAGFSKDGKSVAPKRAKSPWELSLIAGQFIFDDNAENNFDNDESTDAFLFQTQLVASYAFSKDVKATIAPGWLVYSAGSVTGAGNGQPFNDSTSVSGATRNINLLLVPGDVSFKLAGRKAKFLWDFTYNVEGRKRAEDIYGLVALRNDAGQDSDDDVVDPDDFNSKHRPIDDLAFLAGLQLGENKKAGDWSVLGYYRQTGVSSIDPNLNDSDFALSRVNNRGFKFSLAYNFTDFAVGTLTYQYAWNLRQDLVGGQATGGAAIADANDVSIFQFDFSLKF